MSIKQDILISACSNFYNYGFNACGVEFLAKQAGVTKRTLYAHFRSKEGLIESVLKYRDEQFIQNLEEFFSANEDLSVVDTYLMFISKWVAEKDFHGCLFINASAELHNESSNIMEQVVNHKAKIRKILFDKMRQKGIENAKFLSDLTFLVGEGMIVSKQTRQEDCGIKREEISDYLNSIAIVQLD